VKKNLKELGFRYSGTDANTDYISNRELYEASKDCLSYQIIETDRKKLLSVLSKLDAWRIPSLEETGRINGERSWTKLAKYFFGFLMFGEKTFEFELLLVLKNDIPKAKFEHYDLILLYIKKTVQITFLFLMVKSLV